MSDIDTTAEEIAEVLGVDPEKVLIERNPDYVALNHGQARRLLALARKAQV
jgi:hypothetical protein